MNSAEFTLWFRFHGACIADVADWMAAIPPDRAGLMLAEWQRILAAVSHDDAVTISRQFLDGSLTHPPKYAYHTLPTLVRDEAARRASFRRRQAALLTAGNAAEATYRCHWCRDSGWRMVVDHRTIAAVMTGRIDLVAAAAELATVREAIAACTRAPHMPNLSKMRTAAVTCECEAGDRAHEVASRSSTQPRRYDSFSCIDWDGAHGDLTDDTLAAIRHVADSRKAGWSRNREAAFDSWNNGG